MNELDNITINKFRIPGIVLMENAALKVVEEIFKTLGQLEDKNILVFAGKGNNGGDAFAVARHLYNGGARVTVYVLAEQQSIKGDAKINYDVLLQMGVKMTEVGAGYQVELPEKELQGADLVIDGLLGTGLKGEVAGIYREIIEVINRSGKKVIAIDIPSGIDGERGKVCGAGVRAYKTVTFQLPKTGQVIHPGCEYTGELVVAGIGIPDKAVEEIEIKGHVITGQMAGRLVPPRYGNSNKGDYGRIMVLSGSRGMTGAGCLCAEAALRTGAGLVYLCVPSTLSSIYEVSQKEAVTIGLEDGNAGVLTKAAIPGILKRMEKMKAAVVGPGLSTEGDAAEIIGSILENSGIPLILDADALNAVSKDVNLLKALKTTAVLTPHPGEMARLAGISIEEVQDNRIELASEFAAKYGVVLVLKGSRTVVAMPDGTIWINTTGNSGMATAGAGDALAGIIAGLAGQGAAPQDAAVAGVYLHGAAGDLAARDKGEYGMIAGDIVKNIPYAVKNLTGRNL